MRIFFALCLLLVSAPFGFAANSEWDVVDGAKIRLIGMTSPNSRAYRAGLQIVLQPGWKTYWRNPGGSGLPPQLNFAASTNIRSTELKFPVPRYFEEDGSIGYKNSVTFPIEVQPAIAGLPMKITVVGLVGICSDICIPTQIDLSMKTGDATGTDFDIARSLNDADALLPLSPQQSLAVENVRLADNSEKAAFVHVRIPPKAKAVAVFVEGPPSLYLTRGNLFSRDGASAVFKISLSDAKRVEDLVDLPLTFTLKADRQAIEQTAQIDAAQQ